MATDRQPLVLGGLATILAAVLGYQFVLPALTVDDGPDPDPDPTLASEAVIGVDPDRLPFEADQPSPAQPTWSFPERPERISPFLVVEPASETVADGSELASGEAPLPSDGPITILIPGGLDDLPLFPTGDDQTTDEEATDAPPADTVIPLPDLTPPEG